MKLKKILIKIPLKNFFLMKITAIKKTLMDFFIVMIWVK